jgi:hypothetical protein
MTYSKTEINCDLVKKERWIMKTRNETIITAAEMMFLRRMAKYSCMHPKEK